MDGQGIGDQISTYAGQVADINARIDKFFKQGAPPEGTDKTAYEALKAHRDQLVDKAQDISKRAKSAGAQAPDFTAEVKRASAALKGGGLEPAVKSADGVQVGALGDNHDTIQLDAPEGDRGFVRDGKFLDRQQAAAANPAADLDRDGKLHSEELNVSEGLPAKKDGGSLLDDLRAKHPQYKDVADDKLADGLYQKFYASKMSRDEFDQKIGFKKEPEIDALDKPQAASQPGVVEGGAGLRESVAANKSMASGKSDLAAQERDIQAERVKVYNKLKAEGKDPGREPEFQAINKKYAEAEKQRVETAAGFGPLGDQAVIKSAVAGGGAVLKKLFGPLLEKVAAPINAAAGLPGAKQGVEALRGEVGKTVGAAKSAETKTAGDAAARAAKLADTQEQIKRVQPGVAEKRAVAQAAGPEAAVGPAAEQRTILGKEAERAAAAKAQVAPAEQATVTADQAAKALDEELKAKPGISTGEFGAKVEQSVRGINKDLTTKRYEEAGYGKALESAGDELRVDTQGIQDYIAEANKHIKTPATRRLLETIAKEANTVQGEVAHAGLSVRDADSLRKSINDAVADRVYNNEAVPKEALKVLKDVKKQLTKAAVDAWEPYKTALGKYATLSRPLEFITKNPLLRKVVADDPQAAEAAVTRSQLVGKLLTESNQQDRRAFGRLAAESPGLRDDARLYFTESLFGPAGLKDVKSPAAMRQWLIKNKPALDQFGLFDEFKNMHTARQTAQKTLDEVAGVAKQTAKQAEAAEAHETAIQAKLKQQQDLLARRQKELGQPLKTPEQIKQASAERAEQAGARLEKQKGAAQTAGAKATERATAFKNLTNDLGRAPVEDVPKLAKSAITKLRDGGQIDQDMHNRLQARIEEAATKFKDAEERRKRIISLIRTVSYLGGGYGVYRGSSLATGGH